MARAYAAIANGGNLNKPQLVREVGILDQRRFVAQPVVVSTLDLDESTLGIIREGMCNVTAASTGTATHIFRNSPLQTLGVCGKTGTAENPGSGQPHSWFISYAPKDDPQIAMAVIIENSGDGSAIAAPITRRIMEYYFFGIE
jgi:cell division protein FtsI/penicillin-binding protein 2